VAGNAISIQNSIVSGNTASSQPNLFGSSAQTGVNFIGGSVLLAPLGHYGGPTQTMALLPGSPARDSAPSFVPATDQRGFPIVGVADCGAYEAGTFTNFNAWIWETLPTAGNGTTTDPLHAQTFDYDGDGVTNFNEWPARTDPGDNSSYLRVTQTVLNAGSISLTFPTVVGRNYSVEFTENLAPATWTPYGGILPGTGGLQTTPPIGPVTGYSHLFFRIRVGP
jgi:hypothetical protein